MKYTLLIGAVITVLSACEKPDSEAGRICTCRAVNDTVVTRRQNYTQQQCNELDAMYKGTLNCKLE